MSNFKNNAAIAVFGLALGGGFLWLAWRDIDPEQIAVAAANTNLRSLGYALVLYWIAIAMRIGRWASLLQQLAVVPRIQVAETLVIGYAVNNILPARLGELFRADYAKRRFGLSRSVILGSIVIERLLDLCVILLCLLLGLLFIDIAANTEAAERFEIIALNAAVVVGLAILIVYFLRSGELRRLPVPQAAKRLAKDLAIGVGSLNRRSLSINVAFSLGVWTFEGSALWWMFNAVGLSLSAGGTLLVMSAASLSTIVPTAPGYIGTYQLVFVITMGVLGHSELYGFLASTGIQLFLFGSLTLVGISLLIATSLAKFQDED